VERIRSVGVPVEYIRVGRIYGPHAIYQALKLLRLIKHYHIDIVQSYHFKSDTYGVFISKIGGVKRIVSSRRDMGDLKKAHQVLLCKFMNRFVDHFNMVCDSVGKAMHKTEGIPMRKMTTIYNGVDLDQFPVVKMNDILNLRNNLGISPKAFVIGIISYFRFEKAYDVFFAAIDKIRNQIPEWAVLILGNGPLEANFKALCKTKGLEGRVKFMGSVLNVERYIALMDLVCLVPRSNEGFSNAILEGMVMGKPIIATDVGGNAEAVVMGDTGILIPPNDPVQLANAILQLYQNPSLRMAMGEKGKKRVQDNFSLEQMVKKMEDFYIQILEGKLR